MNINNIKYDLIEPKIGFPYLKTSDIILPAKRNHIVRYIKINQQNVSSIINNQIFASEPESFNDLFDSKIHAIDFSTFTLNDYQKIAPHDLTEEDISNFTVDKTKLQKRLRETYFAFWNLRTGILCSTDSYVNELMWAHYTDNQGIAIEYNYSLFPKNIIGPYRINYVPKRDPIIANKNNIDLTFLVNYLIKSNIWSYENEFRFIVYPNKKSVFKTTGKYKQLNARYEEQPRLIKIRKECINKIILGYNFFNKEEIKMANANEYEITLISEQLNEKSLILDYIIKNFIQIELIIQNTKILDIRSISIKISKKGDYVYSVIMDKNLVN